MAMPAASINCRQTRESAGVDFPLNLSSVASYNLSSDVMESKKRKREDDGVATVVTFFAPDGRVFDRVFRGEGRNLVVANFWLKSNCHGKARRKSQIH